MALYSMVFYVSKTILPTDLSPLYELPVRNNRSIRSSSSRPSR